mgnify:CR=1 FL=1
MSGGLAGTFKIRGLRPLGSFYRRLGPLWGLYPKSRGLRCRGLLRLGGLGMFRFGGFLEPCRLVSLKQFPIFQCGFMLTEISSSLQTDLASIPAIIKA